MPTLTHNSCTATTFQEKAEMLKDKFFPPPLEADLTDIQGLIYPQTPACPLIITKDKVLAVIKWSNANKAPGPDEISNQILQTYSNKLFEMLTLLFQAYIKLAYHSQTFKAAHTLALKKVGQNKDFTVLKDYQPIALLNTLDKTLESIMAKKSLIWLKNTNYYQICNGMGKVVDL